MTKQEIKNALQKSGINPDAVIGCATIKDFLKELNRMPSSAEIDINSVRFDIFGNVYIEYDEWGFSGDWWKS